MLTEEFKRQALEKLKNATPERVVEVLQSIGSVPVQDCDSMYPCVTLNVDDNTIVLDDLPKKVQRTKTRNLHLVFGSITWGCEFSCEVNNEKALSLIVNNEEGYAA